MALGAVGPGKPLRLQLKGAAPPPWQALQCRVTSRHGSSGSPLLVSPRGPRVRGVEMVSRPFSIFFFSFSLSRRDGGGAATRWLRPPGRALLARRPLALQVVVAGRFSLKLGARPLLESSDAGQVLFRGTELRA
ncbi:hypothetical protein NDU88_003129 [Pleurodeles waltl]|uniref:Uncharacterized protein n=1 Tax=Pleurodeles waltl TaxID=8319 RepID=A0AAV7UXK9_PLEWA|nr:hypothetical protein NDU88_003129 [Pleurodeles waltl]